MEGKKSPMQAIDEFVLKHIKQVLMQELNNEDSIHLYSIGECCRAFDKSAYALSLLMTDEEPVLLTVRDYPFPVMMMSVHYKDVNKLLYTQVIAKRNLDYIRLITKPIDRVAYRRWSDEFLEDINKEDGEEQ